MKASTSAAILASVVGLVGLGLFLPQAAIGAAPGGGRGGGAAAAPLMTPDQRPDLPPPVSLSAADDHQRMMDLLHVTKIRPGGQSQGVPPEANANPFGGIENLPDPLKMNDGTKITSAAQWPARRAEIVEMFDREIYGRVPADFKPAIKWEVTASTNNGTVITKTLVGHVDMSSYPLIPPINIQVSLSTPANAGGPVPVMMQFGAGGGGFGGGGARGGAGAGRGGRGGAGRGAPGGAPGGAPPVGPAPAPAAPGAMGPSIDESDTFFVAAGGRGGAGGGGPNWTQQCLDKGWGYATISTSSIQADSGNGLGQGVIGLSLKGQPRKLDDWGVLRAWAWGASRALDYFETDKDVDAKQVGLEGHSRWGKSTIVAMAYDQRFAICYCSSSGEGGVKLNRRNYGELVENVAGTGEYYWMAGNFIKYGCDPVKWSDMPVDQHELVAMCAPRPTFISGGAPNGDAWVDAKGMFMAAAGSQPVFALLGKKTMGTNEFPPMETPLIDGDIAFRQHSGGHTDVPNWPTFITFATRYLHSPAPKAAAAAN